MPSRHRSGGLSKGNLFDTNVKATSIDEDIFSDQTLLDAAAADGDLVLVLDVSEDPDKIKYVTKTNLLGTSAIALTGSTNNTVVTVTGSQAIAGEANLLFDGTILTNDGGEVDIDISSGDPHLSLQIGGTDKFTLGVDDSDSDKFKIDTGGTVGGATKFTLDSSGNVTIAGDLTVSGSSTATIATTVTITDNESTNEDNAIIFTSGGDVDGGNIGLESDGDLYYNPSTGRLTATQLAGTLQTAAQTNVTSLGTLTALTVDNVAINGTTIGHTGDTDLLTLTSGVLTVAGEVSMTTLDIGGTDVTTTAAEINLIDGGTSRGTTAVASGDGILINDGGTMQMTNVDTVSTYFASHSVGGGNIVTTGALNSGSITSGFGTINNGSSAITTTGTVTFGSLSDGSVTVTAWVDEDDMSSDSATLIPTQQSVKAYVDSEGGSMSNFYLEDDDGTEVTVSNGKEVKIIGSGVTTNWTDTSHGSDSDPYDLTITVDAAQTGITSIYATDLIMGEDAQTAIDFGTANEIDFKVDNAARLTLTSGALYPVTNNQIDLGTSSLEFKDAFFDGTVTADAFAGPLTGNVTGNASGTAATVTTAAQGNITSLGTLTALTVDDVVIDGKVITMTGSTNDTAVFTVGTNGTLSIVTVDTAAAAANLQITADGTVDIDSAGVLTLDSGAAINIEPASGSAILLDGTISVDAGVVTGATSITSTAFVGDITGDVTGNASGTAATVTTAAQTNITSLGTLTALTVDDVGINGKVVTMTGSTDDTAVFTVGTHGTLTIETTDTAAAAANLQITADGTVDIDSAGVLTLDSGAAINIEPASGSAILLDGTISIDGGAITGVASILQADVKIGEDDQTKIDFETADEIHFYAANVEQVYLADNIFGPQSDSDVDLGTTGVRWKDAFVDSITVTGEVDAVTLDISGNADIDGTTNLDAVDIDGNVQLDGTFTVGVDDTGQDVKFFGASAGAYMEWDESADQLRIMGASADATTSTGKLLLATSLTDINANDVIGKIDFQAPHEGGGTDAITIAAAIEAVAQGTFSASVNATDLIFKTGHSEAATEKIRFTSQGEIGIGGANYGTDGQVLTSGGAGAAVAWEDAGGTSLDGAITINDSGADADFRVESSGNANMLFVDGGNDAVGIGTNSPLSYVALDIDSGSDSINTVFRSSNATTDCLRLFFISNSASPADNDDTHAFNFKGDDSDGTEKYVARIGIRTLDVTAGTLNTEMRFGVTNNAAEEGSTVATLSTAGVWTDSSDAAFKTYEGTAHSLYGGTDGKVITDKLKALNVGRFYTKDTPADKLAKAERHISPTAQDFYNTFGTGTEISGLGGEITKSDGTKETIYATLAPKDMAGVGLMAIKELIARIETLETEVAALKE